MNHQNETAALNPQTMELFRQYQNAARMTAVYPKSHGLQYVALGLSSESGEVAGKVKKWMRDEAAQLPLQPERIADIVSEIGDVLWYLSLMCDELGVDLSFVASANIDKLLRRSAAGTIKGSGDNR